LRDIGLEPFRRAPAREYFYCNYGAPDIAMDKTAEIPTHTRAADFFALQLSAPEK